MFEHGHVMACLATLDGRAQAAHACTDYRDPLAHPLSPLAVFAALRARCRVLPREGRGFKSIALDLARLTARCRQAGEHLS
jgi:hypothetical protein